MKKIYVVGNWKCNKTVSESLSWLDEMNAKMKDMIIPQEVNIIVAVPFISLFPMSEKIKALNMNIHLASQDVSSYPDGAYTGQVSSKMLSGLAEWVIIGHSERRKYYNETDVLLHAKTEQAKSAGLKVIYCVQSENISVPPDVDIIGYEPFWAIGSGKPDTAENANRVISLIKQRTSVDTAVYGGSVTADNVASYVAQEGIDGILPGGASLDPGKFSSLISESLKIS